ncbi:hypothetical protein JOQ06_008179, partial [Pogonophryne albipinna]
MDCRLDATFTLWPPNVEKLIDNPEDLAFLASMKTDRVATFGVLDKKLQLKVKRREERQAAAAARQSRCEKELEEMTAMSSLVSESDEEPEADTNTVCPTSEGEPSHKRKKTGTNVFIPHDILSRPSVVSLATRLKMSPTQQAAFTRGLVPDSGGECTHLSASYATADRARRQVLETISEERHKQWTPPPLCTLHWDSKLTPMLSNVCQLKERLTVVVGDAERLKLLGVPAYKKQTNEACGVIIARLTCKLLQDWCCADQVVNMAFDTTASNTGHLTAACIAIQLSLGRPLLWSGCRHHIGEVLLNQVFTDLKVETSRSPEVTLFTRLREKWNLLPQESSSQWSRYIPGNTEQPLLGKLRAELVRCAKEVTDHKRGDYREFVQLCLVFLDTGGEEQTAVTFQRPGALHKARWMAKLLYTLKLALMKQHIALLPQGTITTRQQVPKIRAFDIFITHIYAKWWLTCEKSVDAAWNDLTLYHHLQAYKAVDEGIAASAIKALERHRWYLTSEMLSLALFSSKVSNEDKRALASAILEHKPADLPMHIPEQRFGTGFGKPKFPTLLPTTSLADLANKDCWFGMHQLHIDPELARKEQHLQNVLQAVEHDRSQQPNLRRCKRKKEKKARDGGTGRWPVAVFYNVLDLAAINAWVLYRRCMSQNIPRRDFMFQLAHELRAEWMASKAPPLVDVLFSGAEE